MSAEKDDKLKLIERYLKGILKLVQDIIADS